jgi:nucleoside 2-deoxyribosyltransferase
MNIYVASSWRNTLQPAIVHALRHCGHEVYDFKNPAPGNNGFSWSAIDPNWESWTSAEYRQALQHPIAKQGYGYDIEALKACDACVLVLPSGRSASWEFGYAMGQGKLGVVVQFDKVEPELMYREAQIVTTMAELFDVFGTPEQRADIEASFEESPDVVAAHNYAAKSGGNA